MSKLRVVYFAALENSCCLQVSFLNNSLWSMCIKVIPKRGFNFFLEEECTGKILWL